MTLEDDFRRRLSKTTFEEQAMPAHNSHNSHNLDAPRPLPPRLNTSPPHPIPPRASKTPSPPPFDPTLWPTNQPAQSSLSASQLSMLHAQACGLTAVSPPSLRPGSEMRSDSSLHSELTKEAYYLPHQCQGIAFPNWPRQDQRELKETGRSGVLASGGEGAAMATGVAREELKRGDVRGRKAFGAWRDVAAGGGGDADEVGRSLPMPVPDGGRSLRREKAKGKGRVVEVREGWRTLRRERIAAAVGEDDEDDFAIDSEPEEEAGGEGQGEVGESDGDAEWEDAPDDEDSDDDEAEHPLSPEAAGHTYIPPSTDMRGKGRAKGKSAKQPCPHGRVMSCKACREAEKKLASSSLGSSVKMLPTILRKMKRMTRRV